MNTIYLLLAFLAAAAVIWVAGVWLTRATDAIDTHFNLGSAFGGLLLLGIAGSLPEIAITVSAALSRHYDVVLGNLIGGIAIQTVVLVGLDFVMKEKQPLSFAAASLTLVLEANLVVLVTVVAIMAMRTPAIVPGTGISLASALILIIWVLGLWIIHGARGGLPWKAEALEASPGRNVRQRRAVINHPYFASKRAGHALMIFAICSVATLAAGVEVVNSGIALAQRFGINGGLFAATFIAAISALPEISTGYASIKIKDYQLAFSDIFGGNAFQPALFIVADLIAGKSVLSAATPNDMWFAALGVLLTGVYIIGLIVRPRRQVWRVGPDSLLVLALYIAGVAALFFARGL